MGENEEKEKEREGELSRVGQEEDWKLETRTHVRRLSLYCTAVKVQNMGW